MFRQYHVRLLLTGHEHLFEHWVERYVDASGPHRMDEIVSGGGGAPLYAYVGEPTSANTSGWRSRKKCRCSIWRGRRSSRAAIPSTTSSCTSTARR